MKGFLFTAVLLASTLPLAAQQQAAPAPVAPGQQIVATINGEVITMDKLDQLYNRMGTKMREQYDQSGGKAAFLENYLRKRLVVQEAIKAGLHQKPDVQADMAAASESALFDRYVRDVVASSIVTDAAVKTFYDEHQHEFATPERVKVRHIVVVGGGAGPNPKTKEKAREKIQAALTELHAIKVQNADGDAARRIFASYFGEAAKKWSEDGSAPNGGDLGWVTRGMLDSQFEEAMFALRPGYMSGIVETRFGYHLILVEEKRAAGIESFEEVTPRIRELMMNENQALIMEAVAKLTNELRDTSKISLHPENIR